MAGRSDGLGIDECLAVLRPLGGRRWAELSNAEGRALFGEVRLVALRGFRSDVIARLPMADRLRARAVLADRIDLVRRLAALELGMRIDAGPAAVTWSDGKLLLSVSASITISAGAFPDAFRIEEPWRPAEPASQSIAPIEDLDVTEELATSRMDIVLRHRSDTAEFLVPLRTEASAPEGGTLSLTATGQLDPGHAGEGTALREGIWDLTIRVVSCGWEVMRRLGNPQGIHDAAPAPVAGTDLVAVPYVTDRGNLSLKVRSLQPRVAPSRQGLGRNRSGVARQWRRIVPAPLRRIGRRALGPSQSAPLDESGT
ncbi:MAG: hypothetical protein M3406_16920 [Chloroflexota bacterium]|nr:hypothetical protein [Chloroflexota bacterium]